MKTLYEQIDLASKFTTAKPIVQESVGDTKAISAALEIAKRLAENKKNVEELKTLPPILPVAN